FPNPVSGILNVDLSETEYKHTTVLLKSLKGQIVYSVKNLTDRIIKIPTANFAAGLYFLQIVSEKETRAEKINIVK
ncbi:MAG TPA: T9SS type A sorting domain-containing protein, partial [Bacteroidia bacterium]|nr:T9SS type A sorting domain-containing protein [Bacteroidia bacterium]